MELRFPDTTCNPYLAFSVMLSAGLEGLTNKTAIQEEMTMDLYKLSNSDRKKLNIEALPHDLFEAVEVAESSEFLKEALGEDVHGKLIETKHSEVDKFRLHVSDKDLREHLIL